MAAKLQVRLTFEGGEEMKRALKELGVEGQKGFAKLETAANTFKTTLNGVRGVVTTVVKSLTILTGAVAAAGGAVVALAKSSADTADQAGKEAQKVGLAAGAYQRLAFGAKESDVEVDALRKGLIEVNKAIASTDPKKAAIFGALGVDLKKTDASGALLKVADIFAAVPDGAEKTALAIELFGRSGAALIPFLNQGSEQIKALGDEAQRLGVIFTDAQIAQSDKFGDTLDRFLLALTGLKNAIGQELIPELTKLAELATNFLVENRELILAWVRDGWEYVIQVVKDLVALFRGDEAQVVNRWLIDARDSLIDAKNAAVGLYEVLSAIVAIPKFVFDAAASLTALAGGVSRQDREAAGLPFARGGLVRGPGTGTSDSILARLSNGEYVMRRAAVDSLGLPFMNALNAGMVPAFADGGAVGGRPVTVNIGGESFGPMTAGEGVVNSLLRYSRQKALRQPGRLPSWMGRR